MTASQIVDLVVVPTAGLTSGIVEALMPRLTPEERVRRDRYVRDADRQAFVVTRALVRAVLSQHGPSAPDAWRFVTNAHGCPSVVDTQAGAPRLEFNVSHTGGLVALAVARGHRVGIDVEDARRVVREDLAGRFFAPAEVADLRGLPAAEQPRVFFDYWTLKEAYLKARGIGIGLPLAEITILADDDPQTLAGPPTHFALGPGVADQPDRWQLGRCQPTAQHVAAYAIARTAGEVAVLLEEVTP